MSNCNYYSTSTEKFDWRWQIHSIGEWSFLEILNHHHLGKKGFRCQRENKLDVLDSKGE